MNSKYIAYDGEIFTVEWYFDRDGKSSAKDFFEQLPEVQKNKFTKLFEFIGDIGKLFNKEKFRHEGDQIYAFKVLPDRLFCFFAYGSKIIITNGYQKKATKNILLTREKDLAIELRSVYELRLEKGAYYEKEN